MLIDRRSSNPAGFYTTVYHLRRLLTDYLEEFMKIKLTESAVEKASCPKGQQALLWDTETKGFGLLVSGSSNTKSFVVRGAVNGRQTRLKVCDAGLGLKRARELAKDMMMKFYRGVDPKAKTAENVTLRLPKDCRPAIRTETESHRLFRRRIADEGLRSAPDHAYRAALEKGGDAEYATRSALAVDAVTHRNAPGFSLAADL
jgi:hypothetical protein